MVATVGRVVVARSTDAFLRAAAEFADGDHERALEQATLVEIVDEG